MKNRYGILGDDGKIVPVTFSFLLSCVCIHSLDSDAFLSAFGVRDMTKQCLIVTNLKGNFLCSGS